MSFSSPWSLLWLIAIPVWSSASTSVPRARRERYAARWGTPGLLPNLVDRAPGRRRHLPVAILLASLAALIVGVARPHANVSVPREEATVLLAIDTSRSMGATDIYPSRLAAAQNAANRLRRPGAEEVPGRRRLVLDARAARRRSDRRPRPRPRGARGAAPERGNGDRRRRAPVGAPRAPQRDERRRVPRHGAADLGRRARRRPDGTARGRPARAAAARPRVHRLLGTPSGAVRHQLPGGYTETIRVPPSPQTLQLIARTTGGQFFRAASDKQLRKVYEDLGSRLGHKTTSREITDLFAGGAGVLLLIGRGLSSLWFRKVA